MCSEILAARDAEPLGSANTPCRERAVFEGPDADSEINPLLDKIDVAIANLQVDFHFREPRQDRFHLGQDMGTAEHRGTATRNSPRGASLPRAVDSASVIA